jgi:hypothetical protein
MKVRFNYVYGTGISRKTVKLSVRPSTITPSTITGNHTATQLTLSENTVQVPVPFTLNTGSRRTE